MTAFGGQSYRWDYNNATTATITVSPTQNTTYTVTATSAGGCTASAQRVITIKPSPLGKIDDAPGSICPGQSVTLVASGGNTYRWTEGNATTASITVSPTQNTNYTVSITNTEGCTVVKSHSIAVNISGLANNDGPLTCSKTTVTLLGSSSALGATYRWKNASGVEIATTPSTTVSTPGVYTLEISAAGGCTFTTATEVLLDRQISIVSASNAGVITCTQPSINLLGSSSLSPASYEWRNSAGNVIASTLNASTTQAGSYTLKVTAANGCSATASTVVTADVATPQASIQHDGPLTCTKTSVTLNAISSTPNLQYTWRNSGGSIIASNSSSVVVTATGTYQLEARGSNGCTTTVGTSITQSGNFPTISVNNPESISCISPSATISGNSTTPGVSYAWYNPNGKLMSSQKSFSANIAGTYTLKVTSAEGCVSSASTTLNEVVFDAQRTTLNVGGSYTNSNFAQGELTCTKSSIHLSASARSGGYSISVYWTNAAGTVLSNYSYLNVSTPGYYYLKQNNCSFVKEILIKENRPAPVVQIAGEKLACVGKNTTLTASGGSQYYWSTGASTATITTENIYSPTTYTVTVSSGNCNTVANVTVDNHPKPVVNITGPTSLCAGTFVTLTASGGYTYQWSHNNATTESINVAPLVPTTYTVTATSDKGCTAIKSHVISTVKSQPNDFNLNGLPTAAFCGEAPLNISVINPNSNYTWKWSTGETTTFLQTTLTSSQTVSVTATRNNGCIRTKAIPITVNPKPAGLIQGAEINCAGDSTILTAPAGETYLWSTGASTQSIVVRPTSDQTYRVTVSNAGGTCSTSFEKTVTVPAPLSLTHDLAGDDDCITNNAAVIPIVSGGTGSIALGIIRSGELYASPNLDGLPSGTYLLRAEDTKGCLALDEVVIAEKQPAPAIDLLDAEVCAGATASLSINNAVAYTTFLWSTGATTSSIVISPGATSTYTVTATASNGCQATDEVVLRVNPALTASVGGGGTFCLPAGSGSATATLSVGVSGGTAPYTYQWINGANTASTTVSTPISAGFGVVVTDSKGCTASAGASIIVIPLPQAQITGGEIDCYGGNTTLMATGGQSYLWSTGATTASITVAPTSSTFYSVTVSNGVCPAPPAGKMVVVPAALRLDYDVVNEEDCVLNNAQVIPIPSNAQGALNYVITPQNTSASSSNLSGWGTGQYTLSATDSKGCMADTTVVINEAPALQVQANISGDTLDCLRGNVQVNLSSTGARGSVSYHFDSPQSAILAPVSFSSSTLRRWVYAVDTVGCVDSVEVLVRDSIVSDLISDYTLAFDRDCIDGNAAITLQLSSAGATLPLSFQLNRETPTAQFHFDSLRAGYYLIRARYQDCRDSVAVLVDERIPRITGFQYLNQDDCKPNNTGVKLQAVSGWGTLRYQLDTRAPQDSTRFDSLAAGSHRFMVIDSLQCRDSLVIPISTEQPAYISVEDLVKCDSASGRISLRPNTQGVAAEYSIDGGKHWQTEVVFDSLPPGIYKPMRRKPSTGCIDSLNTVVLGRHCDTIPEANFLQDIIRITEPNTSVLIRWEAKAPKWYRDTFYVKMKLEGDGFPHFNDGSRTNARTPELRGGEPLAGPNVYRYIGGGTHRDSLYLTMQDSAHLYTYPADYYFTLSTPPGGKTVVDPDRDITRVTVSLLGPNGTPESGDVKILCKEGECIGIGNENVDKANCYYWPGFPEPGKKVQTICQPGQYTRMALDENLTVIEKTVYTVKKSDLSVKIKAQLAVPFSCNNPDDSELEAVVTASTSDKPITFKWSTGETTQRIKLHFSTSTYKVTVTQGDCSATAEYTLPNTCNAQQIKEFFEGDGFFAIPITDVQKDPTLRTPEQRAACPQPAVSANNVVDYAKSTFKVNNGQVNPLSQLDAALDKFKTVFKYETVSGLITSNDEVCACPNYLSDKKSEFSTGSGLKFWYHIFKQDPACPETSCDMLFIKAKMPDGKTYPSGEADVAFLYTGYEYGTAFKGAQGSTLLTFLDDLCLDNFVAAKDPDMFEHVVVVAPQEIPNLQEPCHNRGFNAEPVAVVAPTGQVMMAPASSIWRFRRPGTENYIDGALTGFTTVKITEGEESIEVRIVKPDPGSIIPFCTSTLFSWLKFVKVRGRKWSWEDRYEARSKGGNPKILLGYYPEFIILDDPYTFEIPAEPSLVAPLKVYSGKINEALSKSDCGSNYFIYSNSINSAPTKGFASKPSGLLISKWLEAGLGGKPELVRTYNICPENAAKLGKSINLQSKLGELEVYFMHPGNSLGLGIMYNIEKFVPERAANGEVVWVKKRVQIFVAENLGYGRTFYQFNCTLGIWEEIVGAELTATIPLLKHLDALWEVFLQRTKIHTGLELLGFVPFVGNLAGITNGILYIREGQTFQGSLEIFIGAVGLGLDLIEAGSLIKVGLAGASGGESKLIGAIVKIPCGGIPVPSRPEPELRSTPACDVDEILGEAAAKIFRQKITTAIGEVSGNVDEIDGLFKQFLNKDKTKGEEFLRWLNKNPGLIPDVTKIIANAFGKFDFTVDEFAELAGDLLVVIDLVGEMSTNQRFLSAWKALQSSQAIRRSLDNLKIVDEYLQQFPGNVDAVKTAFESLKANRKSAFLTGLKNASKEPLGIADARRATPAEIADAVNKLRDFRSSGSNAGNLGYLEGTINGQPLQSKFEVWESGKADLVNEPQIFTAIEVPGSSGTWLRNTDSEYKMLNDLAARLKPGATLGDKFYDVTGEIKIVSELPYCESCQGVIQQFRDMFPNIKIILIDGIK